MKPIVSINLALSADGKISDAHSRPSGWTSPLDHNRLLQLRHGADALLVGRRTWLTDRMTMLVPDAPRQPLRCLITRHGNLDTAHPMFHTRGGDIHALCTESLPSQTIDNVYFHTGSIDTFLTTLHETHLVRTLHCEGGGFIIRELLRIHAVDIIYLTLAGHTIFGGHHSPTLTGLPNLEFLPMSTPLQLVSFETPPAFGECFLTYQRIPQCE